MKIENTNLFNFIIYIYVFVDFSFIFFGLDFLKLTAILA